MALVIPASVGNIRIEEFEYEGIAEKFFVSEVEKDDGLFRVRFLALTSDYLDASAILKYGDTLAGKELRWRHKKLEEEPEAFLGFVESVDIEQMEDGKVLLWASVVIFQDTEQQDMVIKEIKESVKDEKPIGDSVGYIKITGNEDEIIRVFFRELSVTPFPKCKECRVVAKGILAEDCPIDIKNAIKLMENGNLSENPTGAIISATIFEDYRKKSESMTQMLESKVSSLENEKKDLQKQIVTNEVVTDQLKAKIKQLEDEKKEVSDLVSKLRADKAELEEKNRKLTTIPQRLRLAQMEGLTDPSAIQARMQELESETPASLRNSIKTARGIIERLEIKTKTRSSKARIGENNIGGGQSRSELNEIESLTPQQLADKYYA